MAETINRTIRVEGQDDGVVALLRRIADEGKETYSGLSKDMERYTESVNKMTEAMEKNAATMGKGKGGGGKGGFIGGMFGGAGSFMGGMAGGVGAGLGIASLLGVSAMISTAFNEAKAFDESEKLIRAMSGAGQNGRLEGASDLGMTTSSFLGIEAQMLRTQGRNTKGDRKTALEMLQAERAYGLGQGESMDLASTARQGGSAPRAAIERLIAKASESQLWGIRVKNDGSIEGLAALGEKVGQLGGVQERMLEATGRVNTSEAVGIMAELGRLGGAFGDQRAGGMIDSLHQAIQGGGNEFLEAIINSAIADADPSIKDPVELRQRRNEGIYGQGNFSAIMGALGQQFSGQMLTGALMQLIPGKDRETYNRLAGLAKSPGELARFDAMNGDSALIDAEIAKLGSVSARAASSTSKQAQVTAKATDVLGQAGITAVDKLGVHIENLVGTVEKMLTSDTFFKAMDVLGNIMSGIDKFVNPSGDTPEKEREREAAAAAAGGTSVLGSTLYKGFKELQLDATRRGISAFGTEADVASFDSIVSSVVNRQKAIEPPTASEAREDSIYELKEQIRLLKEDLKYMTPDQGYSKSEIQELTDSIVTLNKNLSKMILPNKKGGKSGQGN